MHRKAASPVDWAVGSVFFITLVAFTFYYAFYLSNPTQPYEAVLRNAGTDVAEKLNDNVTWSVYRSPIIINSEYSGATNLEMQFQPDPETDINSIAVLDANRAKIPMSFLNNTVIWVANLSIGKNIFYLTYTKNTALSAYEYDTDLSID